MTTRDDAAEIAELFNRYYTFVDASDVEGWLGLWAPEGVYNSGHVRAEGMAELRAFISGTWCTSLSVMPLRCWR